MNSDAINAAIDLLHRHGYSVTLPQADEWIAVAKLRRHVGWTGGVAGFCERLRHPRCPHVQRRVGPTGRLIEVRPTPDLLAFLRAPMQPGRRL